MGTVERESTSHASGYFNLVAGLSLVVAVGVMMIALLPEVSGWGEALALIGLSALANASITPEIGRFKMRGETSRLLVAFIALQIVVGLVVGSYLIGRLVAFNRQIWGPSDLSTSQIADEVFKMAIGVSAAQNLLPVLAWMIAFHGVFLAAMTNLSYWVLGPTTGLVVLGFLWEEGQPVGILGYAFTFLIAICLGVEGLVSAARESQRRGLPSSVFAGKGREVLLVGVVVILLAPIVPDLRGLTGFEEAWRPAGEQSSQPTQGRLRFSTVFQFGGDLRPDPSPAFIVRSPIPLYWRGYVFDRYTGRQFEQEKSTAQPHVAGEVLPSSYSDVRNLSIALEQSFTYLATFPALLFAAYEPRIVQGITSFGMTDSAVMLTPGPNPEATSYGVVSNVVTPEPDVLRRAGVPQSPDPRYLQLPDGLPSRVGELARTLTQGLDNAFDEAITIARYLRTLKYDIGADAPPVGRDVVDYFLFDSQLGYCQHFAAAMAILCRELDIPARVATGFGSGTFDPVEQSYKVLQLNYHAWVEVQFEGFGWVSFDPTRGGVGGPEVFDAAEANAIMDGVLPYYGRVEKHPTRVYITRVPDYISGDETFLIEGAVLQDSAEMQAVPRVPINVTLNSSGMDIFPVMVIPQDTLPILIAPEWTRSDGTFSALCALPYGVSSVADRVSIRVDCLGDDLNYASAANISIPVRARASLSLEVVRAPQVVLVAALLGPGGPMPGQEILFFVDGQRTGTLVTNGSGMASLPVRVEPGTHIFSASYAGNGTIGGASSTVKVDFPPPEGYEGGRGSAWMAGFALVGILIAAVLILLRRRFGRRHARSMSDIYRQMLRILASAGWRRADSMTPYEYASWLEQRGVKGHREAASITQKYVEATYAGTQANPDDLASSARLLSTISEAVGGQGLGVGLVRRWVGSSRSFLSGLLPRWMS